MIKYNVKTVNDWLYNSNPIKGMYYNGRKVYRRFVANGSPTPPTPPAFDGKWKATYLDEHVTSAECGSSSSITNYEIAKANLVSVEIGQCVNTIGTTAFYGCGSLTSVTIPDSVTSIGNYAFQGCTSLTSVTIGSGVTSIGYPPFLGCESLTSMIVNSNNTVYDSRNNCNGIINTSTNTLIAGCKNTVIPNSVTSIGTFAFQGCTSLTSIDIPNSVTSIGDWAFDGCRSLTSIIIPSGVTSIGESVFASCTGLTSVTIPDGVTSIGSNAFSWCGSLTSIDIPNSVTSIGGNAFNGCYSLTSVTVEATTPPTLGKYVFIGTNNCPIYVPSTSVNAYKTATNWNTYASRIQPIS